jgi:hypothetical protein
VRRPHTVHTLTTRPLYSAPTKTLPEHRRQSPHTGLLSRMFTAPFVVNIICAYTAIYNTAGKPGR